MGCVFDQPKSVFLGKDFEARQVRRHPGKVNGNDHFGSLAGFAVLFHQIRGQTKPGAIDVRELRLAAAVGDAIGGSHEGER